MPNNRLTDTREPNGASERKSPKINIDDDFIFEEALAPQQLRTTTTDPIIRMTRALRLELKSLYSKLENLEEPKIGFLKQNSEAMDIAHLTQRAKELSSHAEMVADIAPSHSQEHLALKELYGESYILAQALLSSIGDETSRISSSHAHAMKFQLPVYIQKCLKHELICETLHSRINSVTEFGLGEIEEKLNVLYTQREIGQA